MVKYILNRFALAILALIIIVVVVYFLINLSGRHPIDETKYSTPEEYQAALKALGLDKSVLARFGVYIKEIFTGKGFGIIYNGGEVVEGQTITSLFFGPLRYTLWITIPAFLFSAILGVTLGFIGGYNQGKKIDSMINIFVVFFMGVPSFLLAAFVLAFGEHLGLPIAFIRSEDGGLRLMILSLILPVALLTFTSLVSYTYYTRNEVASILGTNQVQIARSKGLDEWTVFKKHVLRNASIPLISILIPSYIRLLAGSLVIETFFQVPGSSSIIVNAVANAEYNVIMFNTLFFASLGLITNIIVDMLYIIIDPRIRYESASKFKFIAKIKASAERKKNFDVPALKANKLKGASNV